MIITTTSTIEGHPIEKYLGIISSDAYISEGFFQAKEEAMGQTREKALKRLESLARQAGANAVVGVSLDLEVRENLTYYVMATATAVVIPERNS